MTRNFLPLQKVLKTDQHVLVIATGFFLFGIHSMQGWTATIKQGLSTKRNTKILKHTENLFRKNLQLKGVC